ncbi:hypothetical protein DFH28DRAFT_1098024 [Melampsora americana]|nr:hypothetical protein DFH28DRAFT_1098024 [Melampsora americana]
MALFKYALITCVLLQAFTYLVSANYSCHNEWHANLDTGRATCEGDGRHQCFYTSCSYNGKTIKKDLGVVSFVNYNPINKYFKPVPDPNYTDGQTVHSITYFLVEGSDIVVNGLDEWNNYGTYRCPVSKNPKRPTCDPAHCIF